LKKIEEQVPGFKFEEQYQPQESQERHMSVDIEIPPDYEPASWKPFVTEHLVGIWIPLVQP